MATTRNYDALAMTLAVWTGQYNNPSRERDEKEQQFKTIISEERKHGNKVFTLVLTDGTTAHLRLFISSDQDVCFFAKGKRTKGYRLNIDKVESIEAKQKDKFKTFHRNCEKAAGLLAASGLWPDIQKRMAVMAAMTVEDYNRLITLWQEYDELYNHREMTYDERNRLQEEKRKEYEAYFTERGATGDWYHFRQLSENKQIVSIPYGKYNQYDRLRVEQALERARQAEGDFEQETARWYGSYDYSIEVRKNEDGTIYGWYSAEYKGCGNGHYYLLLDATHAIFCEDD